MHIGKCYKILINNNILEISVVAILQNTPLHYTMYTLGVVPRT